MTEPILDVKYWKQRIDNATEKHESIFKCPLDVWKQIEEKHTKILSKLIKPTDSILDCGCGWGRLLTLLPKEWVGRYLGVDISPDFLVEARRVYQTKTFVQMELRQIEDLFAVFDWAILISIRPMIQRNLGSVEWEMAEQAIKSCADKVLYLEYDVDDSGTIEEVMRVESDD